MACVTEGSHSFTCHPHVYPQVEPAIKRVQVLADISRSALCCHSNETRAPIANPFNTAHPQPYPRVTSGSVQLCGNAVKDRQTDIQIDTQAAMTNTHFASAMPHAKSNEPYLPFYPLPQPQSVVVLWLVLISRPLRVGG